MWCHGTPETFHWRCFQFCVYSDKTTWLPQWKIPLENPWKCHFWDSKFQNVPRYLSPQELVPLVQVPKLPTIHYQPATFWQPWRPWICLKGENGLSPLILKLCCYMYVPIQGFGKEVSKTIAELYRSFSRAASLVPTAEANVCCEELCTMILSVEGDWSSKVRRLSWLVCMRVHAGTFKFSGYVFSTFDMD